MRRFFIGGSPELEDISYVAVPSNHEVSDKPIDKKTENVVLSFKSICYVFQGFDSE
jgi:hypothetical protein